MTQETLRATDFDRKSIPLESADQKIKPNYDFLRGKIAQNNKEFQEAYDLLILVKEVASIKDNVLQQLNLLSADIVNSAIDDNGSGDFKSSSGEIVFGLFDRSRTQ